MTPGLACRDALRAAVEQLQAAGIPSPEHDAATLLGHLLGVERGALIAHPDLTSPQRGAFESLVDRRAQRTPLQHLTGVTGFRYRELAVGPGVFVPRPETELLAGWAIDKGRELLRRGIDHPMVVDLATGSGAIAAAIADELPEARVYAVELDPGAHAWAERNLAGTGVELRLGDLAEAFDDLLGVVDIVTCNPPYIPLDAWESVAPEARDHDPHLALFSGRDGLDTFRVLERRCRHLLRVGGLVGAEHADAQGESAPDVFRANERWRDVRDHRDLAGRPRYVTAELAP